MFVHTTDAVLHTVAFGPGAPRVLMLNGWSATWQAWAPTIEVLSSDVRCVAYDTRGTGGSHTTVRDVSLDVLIDDVLAVMDAHGIERCVLAGESLGGFLALSVAERHPERVAGLVLVATPPEVSPAHTAAMVDGARADYPSTVAFFAALCLTDAGTEHLQPWGRSLFDQADPEIAARLLECAYGVVPDASAIDVPTVIVHGEGDAVVAVDGGRALAGAISGAELRSLPGVGHAPTVTRPGDVARAVLDVLAGTV